ncbi:MAG: hypothetical protein VSS75_001765 [Candidatus Parabeggiatoa sp.]|nr:hypothetical protein [Candidatus Parabeggiatoa sp.]
MSLLVETHCRASPRLFRRTAVRRNVSRHYYSGDAKHRVSTKNRKQTHCVSMSRRTAVSTLRDRVSTIQNRKKYGRNL